MIWLGISWRSWMMYSPRSVSTGSMPLALRKSLMPISSPIMVLPLVTVFAPASRQSLSTVWRALSASLHQWTWPPDAFTCSSNCSRYWSRWPRIWSFKSRARSRSCSNSVRLAAAFKRFGIDWTRRTLSASCNSVFWIAFEDSLVKALELGCSIALLRLADRRVVGHAGQHFGDMAHFDRAALALQLAGDVHQAAEISGQQGVSAAGRDIGGLALDHAVGNVGELDAERAAEAAAGIGLRELGDLHALDLAEQGAWLRLHVHLAQAGAGIVIGDPRRECRVDADLRHLDQELGELIGARGKRLRLGRPLRIVGQQL